MGTEHLKCVSIYQTYIIIIHLVPGSLAAAKASASFSVMVNIRHCVTISDFLTITFPSYTRAKKGKS